VSEPRPGLTATLPEIPTFDGEADLVAAVRGLLEDSTRAASLLAASRARLAGADYAARLATALAIALGEPARSPNGAAATRQLAARRAEAPSSIALPAGWRAVGDGIGADDAGALTLTAGDEAEVGLVTMSEHRAVRLAFEVRLDASCRFIAKIHQASPGDRDADSYHLLAAPDGAYLARHNRVLAPMRLLRGIWQRVEMSWNAGVLTVAVDGREACRCGDTTLDSGFCFLGVRGGTVEVRAPVVEAPALAQSAIDGWTVMGDGTLTPMPGGLALSAPAGQTVSLVSDTPLNDLEMTFALRLDDAATFIAKFHHQVRDDDTTNSYHLVSTPAVGYLARHDRVLAHLRLGRRVWQRVRLRWVDQRLEVFVDDRRLACVADNLLQSGYCALGVAGGRAEVRELAVQDLAGSTAASGIARAAPGPRPGRDPLPFTSMPRRNLLYHVWPVRGAMWRWNVQQLLGRIDLFNGRRVVGIVHDERAESPDEVRRLFDGHGCEFVVAANGPAGEGLTFPTMLARVRSLDPNEVTFYAHAKGVKYEPAVPDPVRRWADIQYRAALDDWPAVRSQLERYAMTGSFKMLGKFRAHHYVGDWHYSGTFFWLRHAYAFARDIVRLPSFYGCVEAWPGVHFRREETGCLFMDSLRQLPYREEFWACMGDAAVLRWEAARRKPVPPADLVTPQPFEGWSTPRLEQHPAEFAWLLDELIAAEPRTLLTIGAMHGGVEWHVARRFRALGKDIRITAVDLAPRPELMTTLEDARRRFEQSIEIVGGDSTAAATRERLAARYDAVFIDGDHGFRGSRADLDFALTRSPRLVAMHDIVDSDWHAEARCCVSRVWAEARARHATDERVVGNWGGIGIIRP
jgi:hypothetical protein